MSSFLLMVTCCSVLGAVVFSQVQARVCINNLTPSNVRIVKYELDSDKTIPRACEFEKWEYIYDREPEDGIADAFTDLATLGDGITMLKTALLAFQEEMKGKGSDYYCKKGVSEANALKKSACYLKPGKSGKFGTKTIKATEYLDTQITNGVPPGVARAVNLFKTSYVLNYTCNAESKWRTASVSYDMPIYYTCAGLQDFLS